MASSYVASLIKNSLFSIGSLHPELFFRTPRYRRLNRARLEHLAALGLPLEGRSVLDVSAGIGDHAGFYLSRRCSITLTDMREENLAYMRRHYPQCTIAHWDLEQPEKNMPAQHDVVHAYGLLYHVSHPEHALMAFAAACNGFLLLETSVNPADGEECMVLPEYRRDPTQAASGIGCRPGRQWIVQRLQELFPYIYTSVKTPDHEEFPEDWSCLQSGLKHYRAVFVASRTSLDHLPTLMREPVR